MEDAYLDSYWEVKFDVEVYASPWEWEGEAILAQWD